MRNRASFPTPPPFSTDWPRPDFPNTNPVPLTTHSSTQTPDVGTNKADDTQWLIYWTVFASFNLAEVFIGEQELV